MMISEAHPIDDCWNRIGVAGDQSCEQLAIHVHCRNCPVYAGAAQRYLQRPVGDDYKRAWASHFRRPDDAASDASDHSALVFRIGREWLALPTRLFLSVSPQANPHALPHRSGAALAGIVNLGGKLYPAIALGALLGIDALAQPPARARHTYERLLLMQSEQQAFALPVADLHGIVRHTADALRPPAATINKGLSHFLTGVIEYGDMRIGCLDSALLGRHLMRTLR